VSINYELSAFINTDPKIKLKKTIKNKIQLRLHRRFITYVRPFNNEVT